MKYMGSKKGERTMFVLTIEQPNYNRAKFYFDCAEDGAAFINNCMNHDDGKTSYTLEYKPEKEGEEDVKTL